MTVGGALLGKRSSLVLLRRRFLMQTHKRITQQKEASKVLTVIIVFVKLSPLSMMKMQLLPDL